MLQYVRKQSRRCLLVQGLSLLAAEATPARADDPDNPPWPHVRGEVAIEIQTEKVFDSEDPGNERFDLFTTTEPYVVFQATPVISLHGLFVVEPLRVPSPREDRVFEDHGVFVEELHLDYDGDGFGFLVGKFTPNFGTAWDVTPGIWGVDLAEDYELTERLGLGGYLELGGDRSGPVVLSTSVFLLDTVLDESLGQGRGTLGRSDGGVGNTGRLTSFAVALNGEPAFLEGFSWHLGLARQQEGRDGNAAELGLVAGGILETGLGNGFDLTLNGEVARFENADGMDARARTYLTGGAMLTRSGWNLSIAHTERIFRTHDRAGADVEDRQFQATAGYEFDFGLTVDAGYRFDDTDGAISHGWGVLVGWTPEFGPWPETD